MLELLPTILLRFRENRIGVIADIRKAFQMIQVNESDRDFLWFLWWENPEMRQFRVYRHKRVVFGVNCSPFLLAAVELHSKSVNETESVMADKLLKSLYVDNCATSVATYEEYEQSRRHAAEIMSEAKMDLRGWDNRLNGQKSARNKETLRIVISLIARLVTQDKSSPLRKCSVMFGIRLQTRCPVKCRC